jgi:two-component system, NarL family, invasion response regulator UvrY
MRVLIVDDHAVVREGIKQLLKETFPDCSVGEARNAEEASRRTQSQEWDLLILDLSLPDRSGLDVLKEAKGKLPTVPVVVLSMHSEEEFAIRALRGGASAYVTKDSASDDLITAIHKCRSGEQYMSPAIAQRIAIKSSRPEPHIGPEDLTDREYHVLLQLASGKSVGEVADAMSLSVKTISTYRVRLLEKLKLRNDVELTRYAIAQKLIKL